MDKKLIAILSAGAAVMALTTWLTYNRRPPPPPPDQRRYLHCPTCLREQPYTVKAEEEGCKRCGPDSPLVATRNPLKETGPSAGAWAKVVPALLVELNLLLVVTLAYAYRARKRAAEEEFLYTQCDRCHQRLRYSPQQAGRAGKCPRCRRGLLFPRPEPGEAGVPWWKRLPRWKGHWRSA